MRQVVTMNAPGIRFEGGSGDSPEEAVIIKNADNHSDGVSAEYQYLRMKFGKRDLHWKLILQVLLRGEKPIDRLTIELADGTIKQIHFDTSEFFGIL
jgi:hypothetical protein